MKYFALLGALLFTVVACGSKSDHGGFIDDGASGKTGVAGHAGRSGSSAGNSGTGGDMGGGEAGAGDGGEAGSGNAAAPIVSITSPRAVTDPNTGKVVTTNTIQVLCDATVAKAVGATFDAQTVKIEAFDAKGTAIGKAGTASTQNAADPNEYGATFSLVDVPNGLISFKCSASDKSTPPIIATTSISTFLDNGPTIAPVSPLPKSSFSLKSKVLFKFTVTPAPLSTTDTLAGVDMKAGKVALRVDDQTIDITRAQSTSDPTTYSVNVDLNDPVQFPKTPSGTIAVEITAWNKRGTQGRYPYTFDIDSTPPTIKIISPTTGAVVGGHVTVQFTVTDAQSGVDPSTVSVALHGPMHQIVYDPTPNSGWSYNAATGTFSYGFDSNSSDIGAEVQVHVEVSASDNATNAAAGATEDLYIDNQPPIVDLDPPLVQERRFSAPNKYCSEKFDPLGIDSPNDKSITEAAPYRALVWDETNGAGVLSVQHLAGTDQASVFLYAEANPATPLLVAKHNTHNICDDLATDGTALEHLSPIPAAGASYFGASAPVYASVCTAGTETTPPLTLCAQHASKLSRVIDHAVVGHQEPAIYAIPSVSAAECTGQEWALSDAGLPNGWVCLAALAKDAVGNVGISAPLRVCLNSTSPGKVTPDCALSSTTPPSCTDGCTPPLHFGDGTTDVIIDLPQ